MPAAARAIAIIDLGDFSEPRVQATAARFAQRRLGGQTLIMRMASRITECQLVENVIVVGSHLPAALASGGAAGVEVMNLASMHACERLAVAADASDAEWIVYLPGNRPFVDAVLIDQLIAAAVKTDHCDYVSYGNNQEDCLRMEHLGLAGEVCHVDTLRRLRRNVDRFAELDHSDDESTRADRLGGVAQWLSTAPGAYHLKFIPLPAALNRDDLRFTVEDETDWDDVQLLCETVTGADSHWDELTKLVASNTGLRRSMERRNA